MSAILLLFAAAGEVRAAAEANSGESRTSGTPSSGVEETLAQFVPADIGLCIEADGLHQHVERFLAGPLFQRWRAFPPLEQWRLEQGAHLVKFNSALKSSLGVSWDDLRSRLFGRQWLLAVYPPESEAELRTRGPQGFLLVRAADAKLLGQAVEKLVATQRKNDRYLRSSTIGFGERSFTVHEFQDEAKRPLFLVNDGEFGCLATAREKLEQVWAMYVAPGKGGQVKSLADATEYRSAAASRSPNAVVRVFVQAQSWRPYYRRLLEQQADEVDPVGRKIAEAWTHLKYLAAELELNPVVRLELRASWGDDALSPELRDLLSGEAAEYDAAARVPADCLAAFAGSLDMKKLAEVVMAEVRTESQRRNKSVPTEALLAARLIGGLGPKFVAYASPAAAYAEEGDDEKKPSDARDEGPIEWVLGFDTQPLVAGEPTLADAMSPLIRLGMVLAADAYNAETTQGRARVHTVARDDLEITGLSGVGPFGDAGLFVALNEGRLWLAGTPDAIVTAADRPSAALTSHPLYRLVHSPRMPTASQFVYFNFQEARRTAAAVVADPPTSLPLLRTDAARDSLRELNTLLSLADAAMLDAAVDEQSARVSLTVGVSTD